MTDKRITELTGSSGVSGTDQFPLQAGAADFKATGAQLATFVKSGLVKGDVGLANVDNTSDTDKPISTATQTALDEKQPLIVTTVTAFGSIGGGTHDVDLSAGVRSFSGTVDTAETTFTFSTPLTTGNEDIFTLRLANGGSQIVNWPASVQWAGGTAPTLTTSGVDELVFKTIDGGTIWVGVALLDVE